MSRGAPPGGWEAIASAEAELRESEAFRRAVEIRYGLGRPSVGTILYWLALALLVLGGVIALCQDASCAEPAPALLLRGDRAPYPGLLLPEGDVLRAVACATEDLPTCRAERDRCEAVRVAEGDAARGELAAVAEERDALREIVARPVPVRVVEEPHPWWESPWLWGPVGLAVGVAVTVAVTR